MEQGQQPTILTKADRFIEAACQLRAAEDEAAFKFKLAQITRQKLKGEVPKPPQDRSDD